MGVVYEAVHDDGRRAALKVISPAFANDPTFRTRFRREIEITRRVAGPRTGAVLDADPEATPPWLATELIGGPTLQEVVDSTGPLHGAPLLAFAVATAQALAEIHSVGVIHRDFKPTNVILTAETPKVIDFGIAAAAEATSLTGTGMSVGSAGWMSPEQVRGLTVTSASDVFTWAATVAFATTGRPPFGLGRAEALAYRIVHERPDLDGIPSPMDQVIRACLQIDPDDRPSVSAVLRQLTGESDADTIVGAWSDDDATAVDRSWRTTVGNQPPFGAETNDDGPAPRRGRLRGLAWVASVLVVVGAGVGVMTLGTREPAALEGAPTTSSALDAEDSSTSTAPPDPSATTTTSAPRVATKAEVDGAWAAVASDLTDGSVASEVIDVGGSHEAVITDSTSAHIWRWTDTSGWSTTGSVPLPNPDGIPFEESPWPTADLTSDGVQDVLITFAYNDAFSSVLTRHSGEWQFADLDGSPTTSYSEIVNGRLQTDINVCVPSCADGNVLPVEWRWSSNGFAPNHDLTDPPATLARWNLSTWTGIDPAAIEYCEDNELYQNGYDDPYPADPHFTCYVSGDRYFDVWLSGEVAEWVPDGH